MPGFGSPCGACKFLRRKCADDCVFAPCFCHEQGAAHFAAIHKVFGASNVSKLLALLPIPDRCEAAATISYEAQARLQDPVYGCVAHIFALQQQVLKLQAELANLRAFTATPLLQQEKHHKRALHQQQFAAQAPRSNDDSKLMQQLLPGNTWNDVQNLVVCQQGWNCAPSSGVFHPHGNADELISFGTHEDMELYNSEDIFFSMQLQ